MVNDDSRPPSSESPSFTYRGQSASAYLDAQRKNVLAEVDNRPFSWFHVKICCVAGVGFFTDSYDIFAISITSTMLGYVYGDAQSNCNRQLSNLQEFGVKVATPIGTLIGQLLFGWLADILGRKRMYGVELIIIIVGTLTQAMAGSAHAVGIISALIVWRFLMGIGIGGDYPLSAVITSEFASKRTRGRLMTAVFAFQGWGQLIASLVALIVTAAYKRSITNNDVFLCIDDSRLESGFPFEIPIDTMWRIVIGFGCVPACIALYFRLTIPESPRFTLDIERNIAHATRDIEMMYTTNAGLYSSDPDLAVERIEVPRATRRDFIAYFRKSKNAKVLLGCVWSWFVLDIAFYGLNLNTNTILQGINFDVSGNHDHDNMTIITSNGTNITINTPPNATNAIIYVNTMQVQGAHGIHNPSAVYNNLLNTAAGNVVLSVAGLIPGFWVSFCFIDSWGRKPIQLMGFVFLSVLFLIMGELHFTD
ncbi:hypothetical protein VKT23_012276 [Stygiomarasmius scandens]|uniref:Major facilitator superfamily (MFS) profile domain-containing protein n=1 Tax=Marasmiellus scandens TaxID=2682957 RepID=A0ABR1J6H2_9AGAR